MQRRRLTKIANSQSTHRLCSVKTEWRAENCENQLPLAGKLAPHVYLYNGIGCLCNEIDTRLDQETAHQRSAQAPLLT